MERELNSNLSGNEFYFKACSLLVMLKNSCSKLHCQKGFDLVPFSYKIVLQGENRERERERQTDMQAEREKTEKVGWGGGGVGGGGGGRRSHSPRGSSPCRVFLQVRCRAKREHVKTFTRILPGAKALTVFHTTSLSMRT